MPLIWNWKRQSPEYRNAVAGRWFKKIQEQFTCSTIKFTPSNGKPYLIVWFDDREFIVNKFVPGYTIVERDSPPVEKFDFISLSAVMKQLAQEESGKV